MKKRERNLGYAQVLCLRILILLSFFIFSRILFLTFNAASLLAESEGFRYWLYLLVGALRFDLATIAILNTPFILCYLLPFKFRRNRVYNKMTDILLFYIPNMVAIAFDYIDIIYSRFTQKRMTFDVFRFVGSEEGITGLIPDFLKDYWYILLIYIAMMMLFVWLIRRFKPRALYATFTLPRLAMFIGGALITLLAFRGGFQLRPISIPTVSHYAQPKHYSLVLNTPFTLIKSIGKSDLEKKNYFNEQVLSNIYSPYYKGKQDTTFIYDNVVILILESFSLEYSAYLNPRITESYTPVLDGIGQKGLMLPAYANGTRSMEGIPAVLAGMPTLMNSEYIASAYAENRITSLPNLLKQQGYTSSFMHGGKNGTMNFDAFTKFAEFDYYYGKKEYPNQEHYDGKWGIFDDYYLPYCVELMDTLPQPFFASVFTLSSHHPFTLPEHYLAEHPTNERDMKESIKYADWALGRFFEAASQKSWFDKTLFVLIADHAFSSKEPFFQTRRERYAIPLVLWHPGRTIPQIEKTFAQQIDVMPTILDILHYPKDAFSFGKSVYDTTTPAFAVNYQNGIYQLITERQSIFFDGQQPTAWYNISTDSLLKDNISQQFKSNHSDLNLLKAFIQTYNQVLIENKGK